MTKDSPRPRWARCGLLLIGVIGLVRGLFWVVTFPVVYSDEGQHLAYVETVATAGHIPVTGKDKVTQDAITLFKDDHVGLSRSGDVSPSVDDPNWGLVRQQYEGFQGPLYYLLMAPFFQVGDHFGLLPAVYAVRLATLLLSLTAVPLVYLLAKEVFPDQPPVWLLAPACLVSLELFNSQFSLITNDGIMVPLGAFCLWAFARVWRGPTLRRGVLLGVAVGLATIAKGSAPALLPALVFGAGALVVKIRPPWRQLARWAVGAVVAAVVLAAPWVVFNEHHYGATTGIKANARLTEVIIPAAPFTTRGVLTQLHVLGSTLFTVQSLTSVRAAGSYRQLWTVGPLAIVSLAVLVAMFRWRWGLAARLAWLAISLLYGSALILYLLFAQAGGVGNIVGRHLGVLLPMFCVLIAAAAVTVFGRRLGTAAVLLFLLATVVVEIPAAQWWVRTTYATDGVEGTLVPTVEQSYNSGMATTAAVDLGARCPVSLIAFIFAGPSPPSVTVAGMQALATANDDQGWTVYRLSTTVTGRLVVRFPMPEALRSSPAQPDFRLYCAVRDPAGYRFASLYHPEHPFPLTFGDLLWWPEAEAVILGGLVAVILSVMVLRWWRQAPRRQRRSRDQLDPSPDELSLGLAPLPARRLAPQPGRRPPFDGDASDDGRGAAPDFAGDDGLQSR